MSKPSSTSNPTKKSSADNKQTEKTTQNLPKWKTEAKKKSEERAVNPMTMIPEDVSISGKMPLPPKAEQMKRLYGF
jgi:hypothetical protein